MLLWVPEDFLVPIIPEIGTPELVLKNAVISYICMVYL